MLLPTKLASYIASYEIQQLATRDATTYFPVAGTRRRAMSDDRWGDVIRDADAEELREEEAPHFAQDSGMSSLL